MTEKEFFEGYSVPRNKELMRVLDLVEHLGAGIPRILRAYGRDCFRFTENFLRMTFPAWEKVTPQVTAQVLDLIQVLEGEMNRQEIQEKLDLSDRKYFRENYLRPALELGMIEMTIPEMTIPDKPNSRLQKYRLTEVGWRMKMNDR